MKKGFLLLVLFCLGMISAFGRNVGFAGGSFGASVQGAKTNQTAGVLWQISFSGYGYAALTENLFIGGFGEGFGGKDITSGYGGLALGHWSIRISGCFLSWNC
jgi:hypothetical protein